MEKLIDTISKFGCPRVAIVGDLMLDEFVFGDCERISPEAPVPVLRTVKRQYRLGGAANVCAAVQALGAQAIALGVIGSDADALMLKKLLDEAGAQSHLVEDATRPTIVKRRYVGLAQHRHQQQLFRVDNESTQPLGQDIQNKLLENLASLGDVDIIVLEDYGKGVLSEQTTQAIIKFAREKNIRVIGDPLRSNTYEKYSRAMLLTPNRYEAELASGVSIVDEKSAAIAADRLIKDANLDAIVITLDKQGAFCMQANQPGKMVPTVARDVYDVTGAGDVVIAMLAVALAEGCPLEKAVALSNIAGGLEVQHFGVVPIYREEIIAELRSMTGLRRSKILSREDLKAELARVRKTNAQIIFTNGCFDLLHLGHVSYLQQAKEIGGKLIVAINTDASVRRLKGPTRPICSETQRSEMLAALECVDYVTFFDEDTPMEMLEAFKPDILVKGGSTPVIVGQEFVESYGGRVERLDLVDGLSTTDIISKILQIHQDEK